MTFRAWEQDTGRPSQSKTNILMNKPNKQITLFDNQYNIKKQVNNIQHKRNSYKQGLLEATRRTSGRDARGSEKGEVLLRGVGTLRYLFILGENSACRIARLLRAPPISLGGKAAFRTTQVSQRRSPGVAMRLFGGIDISGQAKKDRGEG